MVETLLKRGLCLKETTGAGALLVFPAYFRRDRPELTEHPPAYVRYTFTGSLDEVYTTLVVRLHHTESFERDQLWRDAADFKTPATGLRAGLKLERRPESSGAITVFLDPKIPIEVKATFMKFVHDHLTDERARRASNVERERFHVCDRCGNPVDHLAARNAIAAKKKDIYCQNCDDGHRVLLFDKLEELFQSPETAERAKEWNREAQAVMDSQSLEQILLGHVQAIAGEAGQIWRPTSFGDWGIDGEIEFKDHKGKRDRAEDLPPAQVGQLVPRNPEEGWRRDLPDQGGSPRRILAESAVPRLARHPDHRRAVGQLDPMDGPGRVPGAGIEGPEDPGQAGRVPRRAAHGADADGPARPDRAPAERLKRCDEGVRWVDGAGVHP